MSIPLDQLVCPISKELPVDPVLAQDGYIYERACIQKHLAFRNTSPMTKSHMNTFIGARHITNLLQDCIDSGYKNTLLDDWARAVANRTATPPRDKWNKVVHKNMADFPRFLHQIFFYENDKLVHSEFGFDHPDHGEIHYFENNHVVRREFAATHPMHGYILRYDEKNFENNEVVRIEFAATHPRHGEQGQLRKRETRSGVHYYEL